MCSACLCRDCGACGTFLAEERITRRLFLSICRVAYSNVRWMMLLGGLAANEHFAWKVTYVDYRSVALTVNVCSSVGVTESVRSSAC